MSQKIIDLVTAVVAPAIPDPYELVDIEYEKIGSDYILSVLIDKPGGITVEDTADLTEIISPLLDTIQPDPFPDQYMLEVSSPGLERPLKTKEALEECCWFSISMLAFTRLLIKSRFSKATCWPSMAKHLTIDYLDKTRHKTVEIPYQTVAKARLAVKLSKLI